MKRYRDVLSEEFNETIFLIKSSVCEAEMPT